MKDVHAYRSNYSFRRRAAKLFWKKRHEKTKKQIRATTKRLWLERLKVALGIASAIEHLHKKRIIHRDIKSSNIGFDFHGDAKLFDFGLARFVPPENAKQPDEVYYMSKVGTKRYSAPEVLERKPYNTKADVYSFGVVLWEIFSLNTARSTRMWQKKQHEFRHPSCSCWPDELKVLVKEMLSLEHQDRPTISQVKSVLEGILISEVQKDLGMTILNPRQDGTTERHRSSLHPDASSSTEEESEALNLGHPTFNDSRSSLCLSTVYAGSLSDSTTIYST